MNRNTVITTARAAFRILSFCLPVFLLLSCKDDFNATQLDNHAKLVVYCFPSAADTTFIDVSRSNPVTKDKTPKALEGISQARISYKVNGMERTVASKGGGTYYVLGAHQPGDRVELTVEADGPAPVRATTIVPEACPLTAEEVKGIVIYDVNMGSSVKTEQVTATFTDNPATTDYYAVRVCLRSWHTENGMPTDTTYSYPNINTQSEPLLHTLSDIDGDFGFTNNYFDGFYIFNDNTISGQRYTLHLNIARWWAWESDNVSAYELPHEYQIQLYKITPELYRYVKSLNDLDNNELAQGGFSQLTPTFSNIIGGIGVAGAFSRNDSPWIRNEGNNN